MPRWEGCSAEVLEAKAEVWLGSEVVQAFLWLWEPQDSHPIPTLQRPRGLQRKQRPTEKVVAAVRGAGERVQPEEARPLPRRA